MKVRRIIKHRIREFGFPSTAYVMNRRKAQDSGISTTLGFIDLFYGGPIVIRPNPYAIVNVTGV
jgi:hypothetical protein